MIRITPCLIRSLALGSSLTSRGTAYVCHKFHMRLIFAHNSLGTSDKSQGGAHMREKHVE